MRRTIYFILIIESFFMFYLSIKHKKLISATNNYQSTIEQIRLQNEHLREKDSISYEQIWNIGKSLDSHMVLYSPENKIIETKVLENEYVLYIPAEGCSSCINKAISALNNIGQCNIIILTNLISTKELLVLKQSIKQEITLLRTNDNMENYLRISYKYPFIFKVNHNRIVDLLFYCQSFEMTQQFLRTIANKKRLVPNSPSLVTGQ